ncbi:quinolinate synthase NadA [Salipaludibacillus agaradhaerens]|uniref:Quinolinate synthase n=1 Tax=Salipaludibacillus agaradhaerens TaxID=76935 RepID=A0A9Q4FZS2_SALAG|nr:quinolinate synthase NadA [Salipaludibacillus agaradhaerens]MCR6097039.1 quinolinate synthase NadA [Salipaludibacillus agaradhaerens]MCR6113476.1 quinolinate synthase NadA [Salipaludibacillus agaradhaerens]
MYTNNVLSQVQSILPPSYKEAEDEELLFQAKIRKQQLADRLFMPGHHYQKDTIIKLADKTGDSLQLAKISAENKQAEYIVFCGVHFMAETADMLTDSSQKVILPDLRAGCSMADMATRKEADTAWEYLTDKFGHTIIPLTYVNSSAEVKAFVGRHGGATVTSSNAKKMLRWALKQKQRVLFLPDQHLGRNTAYDLGIALEDMAVWDPTMACLEGDTSRDFTMLLWKGHCSVHQNFTLSHVNYYRKTDPERQIIVHPECSWEVTQAADLAGSTSFIIDQIGKAPKGTKWAIGTEMNLVKRLMKQFPEQSIISLNSDMCPCLTMNRIDLPHLVWVLDELYKGNIMNEIKVDKNIADEATLAIERMLHL